MRPNRLHEDEIKRRIVELFNLADLSYHSLSVIVHAYNLIQPAPKVSLASVFYVDRIVDKKTSIIIPIFVVIILVVRVRGSQDGPSEERGPPTMERAAMLCSHR
jgi:hypothetical protein